MKTNKQKVNLVDGVITHIENEIIKTEKTWLEKDILLNGGLKKA